MFSSLFDFLYGKNSNTVESQSLHSSVETESGPVLENWVLVEHMQEQDNEAETLSCVESNGSQISRLVWIEKID